MPARARHRVPSAISHTVKSPEEALAVDLFDRSGHRAVFDANGRRVLGEGRGGLERARRLDRLAASLHDGWEPARSVVVDGVYPTSPDHSACAYRTVTTGQPAQRMTRSAMLPSKK